MIITTLALASACGGDDDGSSVEATIADAAPSTVAPTTEAPAPTTIEPVAPTTEAPAPTTTEAPATTTSEAPAPTTTEPVDAVARCVEGVELTAPGVLTVATWFDYAGESDGFGSFEKALVDAVAERLGFGSDEIVFDLRDILVGHDLDMAGPGEKDFDLGISLISITEARSRAVDFAPYYDVEMVLVAPDDSPVAAAASIADLRDVALGAFATTAIRADGAGPDYIEQVIDPSRSAVVLGAPWEDPEGARAALADGTVDAFVIDSPTADFIFDVGQQGPWSTFDELSTVAVLPRVEPPFEQLGMSLEKDSALTPCVELALLSLADDGVLADLEAQTLRAGGSVPVLAG